MINYIQKLYNITIHLLDYDLDGLLFNIELEAKGLLTCLHRVIIDNNVKDLTNEEFLYIKSELVSKFKINSCRLMDK